jgi:hypothetical protein
MCNLDLQADVTRRTLREGARQFGIKQLEGYDPDSVINAAIQFADWYVNNATHWTFCVAWNYWWSEVAE